MPEQAPPSAPALTHDRAAEIFRRAYRLLNEHDLAHVPALFTEDVVFEDDAYPETVRGHEEMKRFLTSLWTAFPDFRFELMEPPYLGQDGAVAAHVRVTGTMSGPLDPPGFAPTGRRLSIEYGGFYELEGERVSRARIIINMNDAGIQLGLLPPSGSIAEKIVVRVQHLPARFQRRRASA